MPVGLVRKWTLVALLGAAVAVTACKDDDDPEPSPVDSGSPGGTAGGGNDAGSPGGTGGMDSGSPGGTGGGDGGSPGGGGDAAAASIMCGTTTCTSFTFALNGMQLAPGCVTDHADASACGISTILLGGVDAGLPEFLAKDPPFKASTSCAAYIDEREPLPADGGTGDGGSTRGNGVIDLTRNNLPFQYPGCCTAAGFCSGNVSMGKLMGTLESNAGYGCMNPLIFLNGLPTGFPDMASRQIRCDPATGELIASDGGAGDSGAGDSGTTGGDAGDAGTGGDAGDGG